LLAVLVDVPASRDPSTSLEIALLDVALSDSTTPVPAPTKAQAEPKTMREDVRAKTATQVEPHPSTFQKTVKAEAEPEPEPLAPAPTDLKPFDQTTWQTALDQIKKKHNTLYSIIRTTRPMIGDNGLTLECSYAFHKKRLNESRNKQVLADTLKAVTGQEIVIHLAMAEGPVAPPAPTPPTNDGEVVHAIKEKPKDDQAVKTISNIFGGAELIES